MLKNGFKLIGDYQVAGNSNYLVQAYTKDELINECTQVEDRGALASVLKVAYRKTSAGVEVSIVNPEYIFRAYLRKEYEVHATQLKKIDSDFKSALSFLGNSSPFGGALEDGDLKKYHYMMGMPYFDDPVELKEFSTYDQGRQTILNNLKANSDMVLVYELKVTGKDISVFGIGLLNKEEGEAHFLPIIGDRHIAAMPYEIILDGKEASMLHGRFRFALHWTELTMGTFTKIMSSPGDVEDFMEKLTE